MPKEPKPKRVRGKRWCFTHFINGVVDMVNVAKDVCQHIKNNRPIKYYVAQVEIAPLTGKPHVQGYVEFTHALDFETVKKAMMPGDHIEPALGDEKSNSRYCSKDDTAIVDSRYREGAAGVIGDKPDIKKILDDVKTGVSSVFDLIDNEPATLNRYHRLVELNNARYQESRNDWKVESVIYRCGPTSTYKSTTAFRRLKELDGGRNPYRPPKYTTYCMNGYQPGQTLMLDEFARKTIDHHLLLELLRPVEGAPLQVNCKGSNPPFVYINPPHIELISNFMPRSIFGEGQALQTFCARVTKYIFHASKTHVVEFSTLDELEKAVHMYDCEHPAYWDGR